MQLIHVFKQRRTSSGYTEMRTNDHQQYYFKNYKKTFQHLRRFFTENISVQYFHNKLNLILD